MLLSTITLLTFVLNGVYCKDSEIFEDNKGIALTLKERIANGARSSWDNLSTANLNGYFNTLVYQVDNLDFPLGFNTTKSSTVAILGHFLIILTGKSMQCNISYLFTFIHAILRISKCITVKYSFITLIKVKCFLA